MSASDDTRADSQETDEPLFEIRPIEGKGKGLVARSNIAKGTRIILEKPLFTVLNMAHPLLERGIAQRLKSLPKEDQRAFLSLHNEFPGRDPFSGTFKTNVLQCGKGSSAGGVFPTISRINHSCLPNANNNWNPQAGVETVYAVRPIDAGEEITISYDRGWPSWVRQPWLKETFGFDCRCALCSLPMPLLMLSDARRAAIMDLDRAIDNLPRAVASPGSCLADCHQMQLFLKEEYPDTAIPSLGRVFFDAFQVCASNGDEARASVFAERALEVTAVCEGAESPETRELLALKDDPTTFCTFARCSKDWKTEKDSVPKDLDEDDFEEWLWARMSQED